MNHPSVNSIFEGRFRILKQLGSGGMSTVYEVEDVGVRRIVALKLMQADFLVDSKSRLRFQREAQAAGALNHPHIARILEFGVAGSGEPYLVMECCHGQSLSQILKTNGALPEKQAREVLRQSLSALAHAHENRVIHRDLKPGNIMLCDSADGQVNVKIIDFGIAKFDMADSPELTKTGEIFGSPLYMSPEQIDGEKVTEKSDQYSLGCLFYECLTGAPPHVGKTSIETFVKQKTNQVLSLKEASMGIDFSDNTQMIVNRLLDKVPGNRFASMSEALDALTSSQVAPVVVAKKSELETKNAANIRSMVVMGVVFVLLSVAAIGAILYFSSNHALRHEEPAVAKHDGLRAPVQDLATENTMQADGDCLAEELNLQQTDFEFANRSSISDAALRNFTKHRQAQRLWLNNDYKITDVGMGYIAHLHWFYLDLTATSITDKALSILDLNSIGGLSLEKTAVTDGGMQYLKHCDKLGILSLKHTRVTAKGLAKLTHLPKLTDLILNSTRAGTAELEVISKMHIVKLYLDDTQVKDDDMKLLARMPLTDLSLKKTQVGDAGLKNLRSCKTLNVIVLSQCPQISEDGIAALQKALPKLNIKTEKQRSTPEF